MRYLSTDEDGRECKAWHWNVEIDYGSTRRTWRGSSTIRVEIVRSTEKSSLGGGP